MLCEQVIGNIKNREYADTEIDYVDIEWHETYKRLHKKKSHHGREIGIRLDNYILTTGLKQGDILSKEGGTIIAVNIPECECIVIRAEKNHEHMLCKASYEIGNKHAALFWGKDFHEIITPYNEPAYKLLSGIHGIIVEARTIKLDFDRGISSVVHNHTH